MKTTKTNTTSNRTTAEIDLFDDIVVPKAAREEVAQAVGEFLLEQTQIKLAQGESPIQGYGKFKKLSKEYAAIKQDEVGNTDPNLESSGEMRDQLTFKTTPKGIEIGVIGPSAKKADGHNNLSGESELPTRRFLPDVGETYKPEIQRQVKEIIQDIVGEHHEFERGDFEDVETKAGLYAILTQGFEGFSRSEIRLAVLRNDRLVRILGELDLLDLL